MDVRTRNRIEGVCEELRAWMRGVGIYASGGLEAPMTGPAHPLCERHWVEVGSRLWERIELEIHQSGVVELARDYWMTVREFERDLVSWVRVWREREFYHPRRHIATKMSQFMEMLLSTLKRLSQSIEVCARDENQFAVTIVIRMKGRPEGFHAVAMIPMRSSYQWT